MNCPNCGTVVAPGAQYCPMCNYALLSPNYAPQQNWQQGAQPYQPAYQQSYVQDFAPQQNWQQQPAQPGAVGGYTDYAPQNQTYAQTYPQQGYAQPTAQNYAYQQQQAQPRQPNPLMNLLGEAPRLFLGSFTRPGEVLRTLVDRGDMVLSPIVVGVALVLVFLGGMAAMRGVVGLVFELIASLTGVSLASNDASMRQGINYIAGQVAPAVGGFAVLSQLIAMAVPQAVMTVYLCLKRKVPFSWTLVLGMIAVTTMPTLAVALLSMLASLVSPLLSLVVMIAGLVIAYLQMADLLHTILGGTAAALLPAKMVCFPVALILTLALLWLVGGSLLGNVFQHMLSLLGNTGSFI